MREKNSLDFVLQLQVRARHNEDTLSTFSDLSFTVQFCHFTSLLALGLCVLANCCLSPVNVFPHLPD